MTTLAIDSASIAADGQTTAGDEIVSRTARKIVVEDNVIYATTGHTALRGPLVTWVKAGADPDKAPKGDWRIFVVDRNGVRSYCNELPYPQEVELPCADGTGHHWATGALKAGKTALEAVRIACDCDMRSGGEIQVVDIAEALGLTPALKVVGAA